MNKMHTFKVGFLAVSLGLFVGINTYKILLAWSDNYPFDFKTDIAQSAIIGVIVGLILSTLNVVFGVVSFPPKKKPM